MAVDLSTHNKAISEAYNKIVTGTDPLNWMICGYEGKTNSLKLVETGDDGLDGLSYALSDSQVQYAFARVVDPKSGLPKYVFIAYAGEGAPIQRKGQVARDQVDIGRLLHGYHVEINARSEADIEPSVVMEKVTRASGAFYSAHKDHLNQTTQTKHSTDSSPVGTSYKKAETTPGHAGDFKSRFEKGSESASDRVAAERRAREDKDRLDREREEEGAAAAEEKEKAALAARSAQVADAKHAAEKAATKRREEDEKQQKLLEEERQAERRREEEERRREKEQRQREEEGQADAQDGDEQAAGQDSGVVAQVLYDYDAAEDNELSLREGDYVYNVQVIDEGWWTGRDKDGYEGMFPANYVQVWEQ